MNRGCRPQPPRPELVRRPAGRFGWLDAHLLGDGWLARLGPEATAVLVLLALAADRHGASFYARERMSALLSVTRAAVDRALDRLLELGLVTHRPWRPGHADGVWQLLPVPPPAPRRREGEAVPVADLLARLGLGQPKP